MCVRLFHWVCASRAREGRGADARDWEKEVMELKEKVKKQKIDISEARKREKSWGDEAAGLRKEWER